MTRVLARFSMVILALSLSVSAFAASKVTDITLFRPAQLNGTTIPPGNYTLRCETSGATAQVKVMKGKKEVAAATGQTKELATKSNQTALVLQNSGQVPSISEVHFANSSTAVTFDSGMASPNSGQ